MKQLVMIAALLVTGFVATAQTESEQQVANAV